MLTRFTLLLTLCTVATVQAAPRLELLGRFRHSGPAEIPAYDADRRQAWVVNGGSNQIDLISLADPTSPTLVRSLSLPAGATANSIAIHGQLVAVAASARTKTNPGYVFLFDLDGQLLNIVTVGAGPDMVCFTPDGSHILTADEGEPTSYQPGEVNPPGSISVINAATLAVRRIGFEPFDDQLNELRAAGVRVFGPGATLSQDLEPEYIAFDSTGRRAFVTLQEANAIAEIDLNAAVVVRIAPLGVKDFSAPGNAMDPSDQDGVFAPRNVPAFGMIQPDAIASFVVGGRTFFITANEGDARTAEDFPEFDEECRVDSLRLDPAIFPDAADLQQAAHLGRLVVSTVDADPDHDGDVDVLFAFGGRSFSIWDDSLQLVFDSGDQIERFLLTHAAKSLDDARSDNRGPEPEGVCIGEVNGQVLGFIGLERAGGVLMVDLSDPQSPSILQFIDDGEKNPEGLAFIPADRSPNGRPLLIVSFEASHSTLIYQIGGSTPSNTSRMP